MAGHSFVNRASSLFGGQREDFRRPPGRARFSQLDREIEQRLNLDSRRRIPARGQLRIPSREGNRPASPASVTFTAPIAAHHLRTRRRTRGYEMPTGADVFAKDRWTGAPLIAGIPQGPGAVLWIAANPGKTRLRALSLHAAGARRSRLGDPFPIPASGLFSTTPIAPASIPIISPRAGAKPASARSTSPPGISTNPTRSATTT